MEHQSLHGWWVFPPLELKLRSGLWQIQNRHGHPRNGEERAAYFVKSSQGSPGSGAVSGGLLGPMSVLGMDARERRMAGGQEGAGPTPPAHTLLNAACRWAQVLPDVVATPQPGRGPKMERPWAKATPEDAPGDSLDPGQKNETSRSPGLCSRRGAAPGGRGLGLSATVCCLWPGTSPSPSRLLASTCHPSAPPF